MFGEMFSPGQHDAEDAVLKLAENAEDAYAIVAYLSTVDWQAVIADRIQEKRGRISSYMERRDENYRKGGGYCDACGEEYSKLFSWPFASRTSEECRPTPVLDIFFGRRDQTRTQEEISKLANEYIRDKKDYEAALWNESRSWYFHRFCWKCLRKLEEEMHVPWQYQTSRCSICDRLMLGSRKLYRIKSKNQTISCCLHCVEQGVETQFTLCQECGKKTANAFSNGLCYECKINEPYRWQVSSHLSRAKAVGAPATLTLKEWSATVAYFGNKCAYCRNRPFEVLEHFLPIILGGGTTAENCVPACQNCNSRKNSMHPDNFYRIFLPDVIEHIKQYLEGNKQQLVSSFAVNNRALVVMPGMQKIANEGIKLSALKKC